MLHSLELYFLLFYIYGDVTHHAFATPDHHSCPLLSVCVSCSSRCKTHISGCKLHNLDCSVRCHMIDNEPNCEPHPV
ncbi:uncharacterized protein RJT20DRAFT_127682 [Scheffersomyces xylosifermentans]|uniref:uncharacterized protein n=1 Tax=Scheffersomyces xylosifermentans TaxID=1304137 RepID=UPI00315C5DB8